MLKNDDRTIAERHKGASILFADIVNFTPLSADLQPEDLVAVLNEVFTHFDELVGDCNMVAAGVPRATPDHAKLRPDSPSRCVLSSTRTRSPGTCWTSAHSSPAGRYDY